LNILILCKRRPQGRDLLTRPYGRFYYLPYYLSSSGNSVTIILISYKNEGESSVKEGGLIIHSISFLPNPIKAIYKLYRHAINTSPDWILGFSDTFYGIVAYFLALKLRTKSLIDAYDNYEAYIPWFKPLHWLWRYTIKNCDIVTCAGPSLQKHFSSYRAKSTPIIIPMAADPVGFRVLNREKSRNEFNLPLDKKIVGYSGAIYKNRDIECLFEAIVEVRKLTEDTILVMSGRIEKGVNIPRDVQYLGYIPDKDLPKLINCFDCVIVINKDSKFGNYSYPIKLYEAMQCEVPVVVTRTESTSWIMKDHQELLVTPGDVQGLSNAISKAIELGRVHYMPNKSWQENANKLKSILVETGNDINM